MEATRDICMELLSSSITMFVFAYAPQRIAHGASLLKHLKGQIAYIDVTARCAVLAAPSHIGINYI